MRIRLTDDHDNDWYALTVSPGGKGLSLTRDRDRAADFGDDVFDRVEEYYAKREVEKRGAGYTISTDNATVTRIAG